MKKQLFIISFFIFLHSVRAQENSWQYYGQTPPDSIPELFMDEQMNHLAHSSPTFSPDGKEIYWSIVGVENQIRKIYYVSFENNKW